MILFPHSRHFDPLNGGGALGLGVVDVVTSLSQIDPFFTAKGPPTKVVQAIFLHCPSLAGCPITQLSK